MSCLLHKKTFLLIGGSLWLVTLVTITIAFFWPILGKEKEIQRGELCCDNLDRIYEAKQALAHDLNLDPSRPYPQLVQNLSLEDIAPYLKRDRYDLTCPSGGQYQIRPLVDSQGEVVAPTCDRAESDPDGDGMNEASQGYHIHRRSHLQNSDTGIYYRDPGLTFPNDPAATSSR